MLCKCATSVLKNVKLIVFILEEVLNTYNYIVFFEG